MSEPATLYLMRHGTPELAGHFLGRTDCDVTEAGIVACVGQARDLGFAKVVSSNLKRARRCAETIAAAHDIPVERDSRWRELDFGEWDGLQGSAIDAELLGRFWADPDAAPPPGGERWSVLRARVEAAVEELSPTPTLIVAHAGAIRAALSVLCGLHQRQCWAFDLPYASVVTLRWWPETPRHGQITGLQS